MDHGSGLLTVINMTMNRLYPTLHRIRMKERDNVNPCTFVFNPIRNRTSNTEIGRAKTGWGAAETGFESPISVLQVLF